MYLVGMHQSESSFMEALTMIPPVTKYLILESVHCRIDWELDIIVTPSESPSEINEDRYTEVRLELLTVIRIVEWYW